MSRHTLAIGVLLTLAMLALPSTGITQQPATDLEEWLPLFNGRYLDGWTPKFTRHPLGENLNDTVRVEDGVLKIRYDKWTAFNGEFGHVFYATPFSYYRLVAEYRFVGEQLKGGAGWAMRNNGLMLHAPDPKTMLLDQDFPISRTIPSPPTARQSSTPRPSRNRGPASGTHTRALAVMWMPSPPIRRPSRPTSSTSCPGCDWPMSIAGRDAIARPSRLINGLCMWTQGTARFATTLASSTSSANPTRRRSAPFRRPANSTAAAPGHSNLALAHAHLGDHPQAIALCQKNLELFTEDIDKAMARDQLANFYRATSDYENAIKAYRMADQFNGRDVGAPALAAVEMELVPVPINEKSPPSSRISPSSPRT